MHSTETFSQPRPFRNPRCDPPRVPRIFLQRVFQHFKVRILARRSKLRVHKLPRRNVVFADADRLCNPRRLQMRQRLVQQRRTKAPAAIFRKDARTGLCSKPAVS